MKMLVRARAVHRAIASGFRHLAEVTSQRTGLAPVLRRLRPAPGATILMFHSIVDEVVRDFIDPANALPVSRFRSHMHYLATRRRVLSLDTVVEHIVAKEPLPPMSVVLTFDDGYRDNLTLAAPVLTELGLPATIYLATGYVDRGAPQWIDRLYSALRFGSAPLLSALGQTWNVSRVRDRREAYTMLRAWLLAAGYDEREAVLASLEDQLRPSVTSPRITLSWDEVRAMARAHPTIQFGAHTDGHIDLSARSLSEATEEVARSCAAIERNLGARPRHFSFPYGRGLPGLVPALQGLGLASAMAAGGHDLITCATDPYAMARVAAPHRLDVLALRTGGTRISLRGRGGGAV